LVGAWRRGDRFSTQRLRDRDPERVREPLRARLVERVPARLFDRPAVDLEVRRAEVVFPDAVALSCFCRRSMSFWSDVPSFPLLRRASFTNFSRSV
jgi:hypothetical protein